MTRRRDGVLRVRDDAPDDHGDAVGYGRFDIPPMNRENDRPEEPMIATTTLGGVPYRSMNRPADEPEIPASVLAMEDVGNYFTPTAPLDDFLQAYRLDSNWWWRINQGHQLNLFEAALERLGEL